MRSGKPEAQKHPTIGLVESFRPGEYERVESVVKHARSLGVEHLRTTICWADWYTSEGDGWYAWLLPRLAKDLQILPCFLYTPASLGVVPKFSSPPQQPKAYADFLDVMITRFGNLFEWIELWNRPDRSGEWDRNMDPDWRVFCEMIGGSAFWVRQRGKKAVLPAILPTRCDWIDLMAERGVLAYIDAVGIHGFPSSPEYGSVSWSHDATKVAGQLAKHGSSAEVWITQAGFSTWRGDERAQIKAFVDAQRAPVSRVYWQELSDRRPQEGNPDSLNSDERDYHYGLMRADGSPKSLYRLWAESGIDAVRDSARFVRQAPELKTKDRILITGGAGFIGTNLASRYLADGHEVVVYDNLSRPGVEQNVAGLQARFGERLKLIQRDVRDAAGLRAAVDHADRVFHFAAQVAVTTSLVEPLVDAEINVGGTLNLLEAIRNRDCPPPLIFTSTNKVYGALADLNLERSETRYQPLDASLRSGISEDRRLDFHSPYGCSKGAADQYVLDYARTFGIPAVVFRMSCIYGPHQLGTEDQGWVAHFVRRIVEGTPIEICGDGLQVRDLLYVEDLVDAFLLAQANIPTLSGQAFNIGGGLGNTASLTELVDLIASLVESRPELIMSPWRAGDQRYYVSDTRKFKSATGWSPKVSVRQGVENLLQWVLANRSRVGTAEGPCAVLAR